MRVRTLPAAYLPYIDGAISNAIREARRDAKAREQGQKPTIPDLCLDLTAKGDAMVTVAHLPTERQQLEQEEWPEIPATDAIRFPAVPAVNRLRRQA